LAAVGAAAAPWVVGRYLEAQSAEWAVAVSADPASAFEVSLASYRGGWRDSSATSVWRHKIYDLQLTVEHEIEHGPGAGLARVVSRPVLDGESRTKLARIFGETEPFFAETVVAFDGGSHTELSVASVDTVLPEGERLRWERMKVVVEASRERRVRVDLSLPELTLDGPQAAVRIGGVTGRGDWRIGASQAEVSGETVLELASVGVRGPDGK
jgi:hypothetical protein